MKYHEGKKMNKHLIQILILLVVCCTVAFCLECYTCVHQENNKDKCIKTVKQCEQHQDVCRTNISWGIPPYWTPHGDRIYKISKDCDTANRCEGMRYNQKLRCKRDWFDDWDCVECCYGDMCNYYVTLTASSMTLHSALILLPLTVLTFITYFKV